MPVALVVLFPVIEWVIHVVILHWRPRKVGGVPVDSLLSRKHRAHHADPRVLPLVFIPWQVELWLLPSYVVIALLAFPGQAAGATFLVAVGTLMFNYEWVHYLVHSDYRPRSKAFRAVWRNHRLHHYKNEHYWFTVTTSGTADRLFGTYPDSGCGQTSKTVAPAARARGQPGDAVQRLAEASAERGARPVVGEGGVPVAEAVGQVHPLVGAGVLDDVADLASCCRATRRWRCSCRCSRG